jgi:phage-related protein
MADIRTLKLALLADTQNFSQGLDSANVASRSFSKKLGSALKKGAIAFAALGAAAGAAAIKIGVDAIGAASDFAEEISKSTELFGDAQKGVQDFAEQAARKLGQTRQEALAAANNFAIFGKAAGLGGKELTTFSTDFVALASDLASFNNTSPEAALNAIGSALRGEAEPIRKYGILLNDATLKQEALELGLIKTTKNALTPQQKVLAAQSAIYKQSAAAQGDFERTSGGLANKQRILKAVIADLRIELGTALLPIALQVFTFFADRVVPIIEKVVKVITDLVKTIDLDFGSSLQNLDAQFNKVVDILTNHVIPVFQNLWSFIIDVWVPGVKAYFTPIIEGIVIAFNKVRDALAKNEEKLKPLYAAFETFVKWIASTGAPFIGKVFGLAFQVLGEYISTAIDIVAKIVDAIDKAIKTVQNFIDKIKEAIDFAQRIPVVGNLIPGLPSGAGTSNTVVNNINIKTAVDPQATARAITKVTNSAFKTTGISFINPAFR